jgi:hypothetical protein
VKCKKNVVCKPEGLGNLRVDGGILLKWIFKIGYEGVNYTQAEQNRVQWRALVDTVISLRVL